MPFGAWELQAKNGEIARFSAYAVGAMNKRKSNKGKYTDNDLRDDLLREMKHCRKILVKEAEYLPPLLLKEVLGIVWANKGK